MQEVHHQLENKLEATYLKCLFYLQKQLLLNVVYE